MSKIILGTLRPPLATNATAGIIKGGEDITIGTGGEPVVNTNYDTVDVNTAANIQNIVKGMKFKSILGNIVSALMGLNGDVSKMNSDLMGAKNDMNNLKNKITFANVARVNFWASNDLQASSIELIFDTTWSWIINLTQQDISLVIRKKDPATGTITSDKIVWTK
ncbi:hypothetical protein C0033_07400 [Clostridium sp. chh4-2]|uniref:hypothetical protein n=1 Tax=Clostridium sp. chh4-2 TaxID=2067550 RepID=UPI000CCED543|nr:hypothetical protein [Clostridium sp. chh4-2]PNV62834.1 hypothetical protein C0033_07400 [Clostridium sp. chh4-2]